MIVVSSKQAAVFLGSAALVGATAGLLFGLGEGARLGQAENGERPDQRQAGSPAAPPADDAGLVGVVVPTDSIKLSAKESGVVVDISVATGTKVAAGDVIAVVQSRILEDQLGVEKSAVAKVRAEQQRLQRELERAEQRLERAQALGDFVAREQVEEARAERDILRARLDGAIAALAEQRKVVEKRAHDLDDLVLRAPFAGSVGHRFVDRGAVVSALQPIVELVSSGPHLIRFAVPEQQIRAVVPGTRIAVKSAEQGVLPATVTSVAPAVDPVSGVFHAEARLAETQAALLAPGTIVRVVPTGASAAAQARGNGRER